MKHNSTTLKKLEAVLEAFGYTVRYEKGNFLSGYCILQQREERSKVVVVNKFFETTARVGALLDILRSVATEAATAEAITAALLDEEQQTFLTKVKAEA